MKNIGILVEFSRMYGRSLIEGIASYAQEIRNWILRPLTMEDLATDTLQSYDGIIARIGDDQLAKHLLQTGKPTVDVFCQKQRPQFAMINSNHKAIAQQAARFFISRGFKNLAFCGTPGIAFSDDRQKAFRNAVEKNPEINLFEYIPPQRFISNNYMFYKERPDENPDIAVLEKWVNSLPKPVAVFCCNDLRALQLQEAAIELEFRVPEDIVILGVDNDPILCSFAKVPISSIDPNAIKVGYKAAQMLDQMIESETPLEFHSIATVPQGEIIERASSEYIPIDPPWFEKALMYIEKNIRHPVSANTIFILSGRSSTFVEKTFKERLGMPVQSYINSVKMREATRLLKNTDLQIAEIAFKCGYSSPQYFCRIFKDTFSMSAKAFRESPDTAPVEK